MANTHQIEPCLLGLACAALDPGLRSVLIEDCPPATLDALAMAWAKLLEAADGQPTTRVSLSSSFTEDDLWGGPDLQRLRANAPMSWRDGALTQFNTNTIPKIVCIPNLAQQNLATERAAVMLIGAPVSTLQRHGLDTTWEPNLCWLAACEHHRIGEVSPHLLDRLVLRLPTPLPLQLDRVATLRARFDDVELTQITWNGLDTLIQQMRQVPTSPPIVSQKAITTALELLDNNVGEGLRRSLTLGRLGRALAWLAGAGETTEADIRRAAMLIGLKAPAPAPRKSHSDTPSPQDLPAVPEPIKEQSTDATQPTTPRAPIASPTQETQAESLLVGQPDQEEVLPTASMAAPREPYSEDHAPILRDRNALQLPLARHQHGPGTRGVIIGTQPADDTRDLALFETVLEGLKYRNLRAGQIKTNDQMSFTRSDLRSYRRTPQPEQLLVLLLDYTCLRNLDWVPALMPHLTWAYVERAVIGLVQVGVRNPQNPLRAELLKTRRLLDLRLDAALLAEPGAATPLAHGLELAERLLRTELQHGRASTRHARLVVLSDGRGNVPLEASRNGNLGGTVGREGINDALAMATKLRAFNRVTRVLLDPQPLRLADLPQTLADALGASVEKVPQRDGSGRT